METTNCKPQQLLFSWYLSNETDTVVTGMISVKQRRGGSNSWLSKVRLGEVRDLYTNEGQLS